MSRTTASGREAPSKKAGEKAGDKPPAKPRKRASPRRARMEGAPVHEPESEQLLDLGLGSFADFEVDDGIEGTTLEHTVRDAMRGFDDDESWRGTAIRGEVVRGYPDEEQPPRSMYTRGGAIRGFEDEEPAHTRHAIPRGGADDRGER